MSSLQKKENSKIEKASTFEEIIKLYENESRRLKIKSIETYWHRYIFRRVPMLSGVCLFFYIALISLVSTKTIKDYDAESMIYILNETLFHIPQETLPACLMAIFIIYFLIPWCVKVRKDFVVFSKKTDKFKPENCTSNQNINNRGNAQEIKKETEDKNLASADNTKVTILFLDNASLPIKRLFASTLLIIIFYSAFLQSLNNQHPKEFYVSAFLFGFFTFGALLVDKTLGYTRQNERYKLFSAEAAGLAFINRSRKELGIQFGEDHLKECALFFDNLRKDKHAATLDDSFHILQHLKNIQYGK